MSRAADLDEVAQREELSSALAGERAPQAIAAARNRSCIGPGIPDLEHSYSFEGCSTRVGGTDVLTIPLGAL